VALCAAGGRPRPQVNQRQPDLPLELTPDFAFPSSPLLVEIDSARWHLTRTRWEDDHERDRVTIFAGYRTLRLTDRQLDRDGNSVLAAARAALGIA
jgi:very-short-patch-repair endonuclease